MKRVISWIGLVMVLLASVAIGLACIKPERDFNKVVQTKYYRNSVSDIVKLEIPEGYINRWVTGPKFPAVQDHLFLHASGEGLMPETPSNGKDFKFPDAHAREIGFGLDSLFRLPPELVERQTETSFQRDLAIRVSLCKYETHDSKAYGLTRRAIILSTCADKESAFAQDVYFTKHADGRLKTVLRCSPPEIQEPPAIREPGLRLVPRCEHRFFFKDLNGWVTLNYARRHLPHWRQLEETASQRLLSFVKTN